MSRELNMDTQRQNFWKESIVKEAYIRLAWQEKFKQQLKERDSQSREENRKLRAEKIVGMVPKPPKRVLPVITYPPKPLPKIEIIRRRSKDQEGKPKEVLVEMRPVSPDIRNTLYHGFTKEGRGRYQYLRARTMKKPEEKYGFPITTSWEYGWRLDDVVKEFRSPQYGRSRIVRDTFFRRNGILYDPVTA